MTGKNILHYKIMEKLGEGGMGVVYLAEDLNLERNVAIKFLPHNISVEIEDIERFKTEAKAAASLNHPNITTIHAIEESGDQIFIVMEFIEGIQLSQKIKAGPISIKDAVNISIQISEALEAAHKKGIVHRDIKSQNIMITNAGQVKIMDFGLAKIGKGSKVTKKGATLGTIGYIPPEQIRGLRSDARSDIFSFGVVMYEMLTGHLPFEAEYEAAVLHLILNEQPEPIKNYRPDAHKGFCSIIRHALEKDPGDRYQSVSEILMDLYQMGEPNSNDSGSSEVTGYEHFKSLKYKKLVFGLSAFTLFVLFLAGYFFFFTKSETVKPPPNLSKSLAVMYFENLPDPLDRNHIGEMLTNLLITSLSQTRGLEVISREQLYKILEDINLPDSKTITKKTAMKVAESAGISTILVGSILQDEPTLSVTIKLIDVNTGHILGSQRLAGFGTEEIFRFIDSLALLVRNDLKIIPGEFAVTKSVAEVTTDSPEAYRAYVEGISLAHKLYMKDAISAFRKAIELDTSFAMAYYNLAIALDDPVESVAYLRKAVVLADNTTERERLLILALNYSYQGKIKEASEIYRQVIEKYPHEIDAYNNLALMSSLDINILLRGLQANPSAKLLWNQLAIIYALNNQKQKALYAIKENIKLSPAEPNPYDTEGEIYGMFMEYDSSAFFYKKALEFRKDFWNDAVKLANYNVLKGKYEEARKYFNMAGDLALTYPSINIHRGLLNSEIERLKKVLITNNQVWPQSCSRAILIHLYYETKQFGKMLQLAKESTVRWKKIFPNDHYGRQLLAWALVKNGRSSEAQKIIEGMLKNKEGFRRIRVYGLNASATLSYEKGLYGPAVKRFEETFSEFKPNHEPNLFYAVCLLKTGRTREAVEELDRMKNWPMSDLSYHLSWAPGEFYYCYINNVKAHYWLGIAYEKLGEKERAVEEYKIFKNTWKDADFNSPELKDAQVRLAKLE